MLSLESLFDPFPRTQLLSVAGRRRSGEEEGSRLVLCQRLGGGDKFCQIGCNSYWSYKGHRLFNTPLKPWTDWKERAPVTVNN